ncbi:Transmembrane exosortase (Exosortase_EpsH) [Roseivivax jejudonensis]|uniref:Transmembrane exosortase (Exosortase_EpsH) n=1 Tax=Roseivivax jejudonensis TaxID=1529041 RepID=A0A1X6YRL9_9RHOB|nr:exosortase E/protease, VPEID-CTERM system [Roseivivax jejudonensis]SLN28491.1 Transmembrane exosortase (Exosortase_EpsH) [Roseivivax jejudonensis]
MGRRLAFIATLFALEAVLIVLVFQVLASVECRLTDIEGACRALRGALVRAISLGSGVAVLLWAKPDLRHRFVGASGKVVARRWVWPLLHGIGVLAIFAPLLTVTPATIHDGFARVFAGLLGGGLLAAVAGLLWVMPARAWRDWLRRDGTSILGVCVLALLIPDLAALLAPLWALDPLVEGTFGATAGLLRLIAPAVNVDPGMATIGLDGFAVIVASQCSGIEGFALLTGFLAIYAVIFRDIIRWGRFWLVVWPLGLLLSWALNVVRIAALILIGAHVSPELAVNGFHSFAGWFYFTILALGVIAGVQAVPWLHRDPRPRGSDEGTMREDWAVARILPFIVCMLSGIIVHMAFTAPAVGYPLQAAAIAAALWYVRRPLMAIDWRIDPVALAAGIGVGAVWLITAGPGGDIGIGALSGAALALWIAARVIGTGLLVPVVEEAFFRGYVLTRLDPGTGWGRAGAVAASAGLFAALHGRPVAAGVAGLVFALVMLRQGRLSDAIVAHASANLVIAGAALLSGDWSLI